MLSSVLLSIIYFHECFEMKPLGYVRLKMTANPQSDDADRRYKS